MKDIKVTNCTNCPFAYYTTNSWDDEFLHCSLIRFLNSSVYVDSIVESFSFEERMTSNEEDEIGIKVPDWCPLLKESVKINFDN